MSVTKIIKSNPVLKKLIHWMIIPSNDFRPRLWIRLFVNPVRNKIGKNTIIRSSTRMDILPFNKFEIGSKSLIEDFSTINNGVGDVKIGNNTIIGLSNVIIGPVVIGDGVMLAQHIVVSGLNHGYEAIDISPSKQPVSTKLITIDDDVWIGANAVITAGVHIGKHAVIGAGSVVVKDIPDYSIAVGNPAKVIKKYNFESQNWEKVI
ncbi:acyltransferase [Pedobacter cryophilus]|uniref:Acyltransferase n=1 Tax=Pedobacter cryophilus TaxID=2571271 RepID=A0A4U1BXV2_9SPHI|nr:acyltransferase [Pedobacter cryophilus]TKB97892.1 acyltransferase [Pedobacter cryophilus]